MRIKRNHQRVLCAALVLVAFFAPAYGNVSAFQLIFLALSSVHAESEITLVDVLIILLPLLLIPAAAAIILIRAIYQKPPNSFLLGLPFFALAFFFVIFSFDVNRQVGTVSVFGLLGKMQTGFYVAAFASLLLLLSYSRSETLNLRSNHR